MLKNVFFDILMSLDMFRERFSRSVKQTADDFLEIAMPVDDYNFKAYDGSFLTLMSLKGYSSMINDQERKAKSQDFADSISVHLNESGFQIQIVEICNPDLTKNKLLKSMDSSLQELQRMGLGAKFLTTDYVDFLATSGYWKEQFIVLITKPTVKTDGVLDSDKELDASNQKILNEHVVPTIKGQTVCLTSVEKSRLGIHKAYVKNFRKSLSSNGFLAEDVMIDEQCFTIKEALYGEDVEDNWLPNLRATKPVKKADEQQGKEESLLLPPLAEQIVTSGYTDDGLAIPVGKVGNRYFSTVAMTLPQMRSDKLFGYQQLARKMPSGCSYITSQRLESDPFNTSQYQYNKWYAALGAVIPLTDNKRIRSAHDELEKHHKDSTKTYIWMSFTVTVFGESESEVVALSGEVKSIVYGWGKVQSRSVEQNKLQALFDAVPVATTSSRSRYILEDLKTAIYQSALFTEARPYPSSYWHFINTDNTFFPFKEHSANNINFNAYICGESGTGKSTLLSILNLNLLAMPKSNEKLYGMWPLIFSADMGKTSFGTNDTLSRIIKDKKLVFNHEMTTGLSSAFNMHDLQLGRTSATGQQHNFIVKQLSVLICGVDEHNKLQNQDVIPMITKLVKEVYKYYSPENSPKIYDSAANHKELNKIFIKLGIETEDRSYFDLTEEIMLKSKGKNVRAAAYCQRFAVPLLEDYSLVLSNSPALTDKYKKTKLSTGQDVYTFFINRLSDVIGEYHCFNSPTKLEIDAAKIISIDIDNVSANNVYNKIIFTGLLFMIYRMKSECLQSSPDLFNDVKDVFLPNLKRNSQVNYSLPSVFNVEEAHEFMTLFDSELCAYMRKNRKEGWGIRSFSQTINDPSDVYLGLCSSVYITSDESESVTNNNFTKRLGITRQVQHAITKGIKADLTQMVIRIKTNKSTIAQQVGNRIPSGLLWSMTSTTEDVDFKNIVMDKFGDDKGMEKLANFFKSGNIKHVFGKQIIKKVAANHDFNSVGEYALAEMEKSDIPPNEFLELVARAQDGL
ncbi:MAG: hypothetical protein HAW67_04185 [Endozoicomonadaceae bacterium]|nr:hypothetical protein [Endozoicomonadaceae bacterium]